MKISDWLKNVFPKRERRRHRGDLPVSAWVETLENRVLLSGQTVLAGAFTTIPGDALVDVDLQFELTQGADNFQEMGVFLFDADGTVDGLTPGSEGFTDAVLNRRQVVFDADSSLGSTAMLTFIGGDQIGLYFSQDQTTDASADRFDVQMTSANTFRLGFEENASIWPDVSNLAGSSTRQFDDAVVQVTQSEPVRFFPPTLDPLGDRTIAEEQPLEFIITAQNPEGPQSDLRYRLDTAPAGASIDEMTGRFTWTPTEAQGPGRYDIVVTAFNSTRPAASVSRQFSINVTEVNTAPVIAPIPDSEVNQLEELTIQISATDADRPILPANRFTFSLVDNTIRGARIDSETGEFTWTPTEDDEPGTFVFEVRVVDNGTPQLSDTETFTVQVNPAVNP